MHVIVFKNPNGTCGIINPAPRFIAEYEAALIAAAEAEGKPTPKDTYIKALEYIAKKDVPEGLPWRIIARQNLPSDRTFRDAWTDDFDTETVDVHMEKARALHMDNIRAARKQKFIDMGFPHKLNEDLEAAVISQETIDKLQALRDLPETVDLSEAKTPEELKAIWPDELKG